MNSKLLIITMNVDRSQAIYDSNDLAVPILEQGYKQTQYAKESYNEYTSIYHIETRFEKR